MEDTRRQQGQVARHTQLFAPGYMDHRVERFGEDKTTVDQDWDFAADYRGPQYHLYPMQMFTARSAPCRTSTLASWPPSTSSATTSRHVASSSRWTRQRNCSRTPWPSSRRTALIARSDPTLLEARIETAPKDIAQLDAKDYDKFVADNGLDVISSAAVRSKTAYEKMGWWSDDHPRGAVAANSAR